MIILGFESSCDETSVAVVRADTTLASGFEILSNIVATQIDLHAQYGGVVPEIASRNHMAVIANLTSEALHQADCTMADIDAIAVTNAPGLIGALLVGVNFAKTLAYKHDKRLIAVHHLRGHIVAGRMCNPALQPPFLTLLVSGGNTLLVSCKGDTEYQILGATRDDAVGEVFDKVARILGLGFPGGPAIEKAAKLTNPDTPPLLLPTPKLEGLDMSFSGIKTAFINHVHNLVQQGKAPNAAALSRDFQTHIVKVLTSRMVDAFERTGYNKWLLCGGVAANTALRQSLQTAANERECTLTVPPMSLCGDNAAMIAAAAYYEKTSRIGWDLNACATWEIDM
ncbi:MAG: tRNA (adenosine(37)-N6)-threonylcarbamoyltransferase complex transferase subunit TsaD [Oscillospiraceae bacterium]|nr:tRNA (adenosine(37)-N6)-threonylcarbamoyltransferase complex transferase subunit TsaD [Oscillospiraceae bacterium]